VGVGVGGGGECGGCDNGDGGSDGSSQVLGLGFTMQGLGVRDGP